MKIPAAFVDRVEADGFLQMGIDPENNAMMKHVMRKAIINALPFVFSLGDVQGGGMPCPFKN